MIRRADGWLMDDGTRPVSIFCLWSWPSWPLSSCGLWSAACNTMGRTRERDRQPRDERNIKRRRKKKKKNGDDGSNDDAAAAKLTPCHCGADEEKLSALAESRKMSLHESTSRDPLFFLLPFFYIYIRRSYDVIGDEGAARPSVKGEQ